MAWWAAVASAAKGAYDKNESNAGIGDSQAITNAGDTYIGGLNVPTFPPIYKGTEMPYSGQGYTAAAPIKPEYIYAAAGGLVFLLLMGAILKKKRK